MRWRRGRMRAEREKKERREREKRQTLLRKRGERFRDSKTVC